MNVITNLLHLHRDSHPVRFAVVGLGNFAQTAVLPAFANIRDKATLAALVTGDVKRPQSSAANTEHRRIATTTTKDCWVAARWRRFILSRRIQSIERSLSPLPVPKYTSCAKSRLHILSKMPERLSQLAKSTRCV